MMTPTQKDRAVEASGGPGHGSYKAFRPAALFTGALVGRRWACIPPILVGLLVLLVLPVASAAPPMCSLRGYVVEPGGHGVPGVSVELTVLPGGFYTDTTEPDGSYEIPFLLLQPTVKALLFARLPERPNEPLMMTGAMNFRHCRQDRYIFVNANEDVPLGPPVPPGPGTGLLIYPGPQAPPPAPLADVLVYLDSGDLLFGGLTPGSQAQMRLCVSKTGPRLSPLSLDRVRYEARFESDKLYFSDLRPDTSAFESVWELKIDNKRGLLIYEATSQDPVSLPLWPECQALARVRVEAKETARPGTVATVLGDRGSVVRQAVTLLEGDATRSGTYVDILEAFLLYLPIVERDGVISP